LVIYRINSVYVRAVLRELLWTASHCPRLAFWRACERRVPAGRIALTRSLSRGNG